MLPARRFLGSSKDIPRPGRIQCHEANQFCITIGAISQQGGFRDGLATCLEKKRGLCSAVLRGDEVENALG